MHDVVLRMIARTLIIIIIIVSMLSTHFTTKLRQQQIFFD